MRETNRRVISSGNGRQILPDRRPASMCINLAPIALANNPPRTVQSVSPCTTTSRGIFFEKQIEKPHAIIFARLVRNHTKTARMESLSPADSESENFRRCFSLGKAGSVCNPAQRTLISNSARSNRLMTGATLMSSARVPMKKIGSPEL